MKFIALLLLSVQTATAVTVQELQCEHRRDPLGVDVPQPRLSWILDSGRQTAYQLVVDGAWDSGWVASDQSVNVPYAGKPLAPGTALRLESPCAGRRWRAVRMEPAGIVHHGAARLAGEVDRRADPGGKPGPPTAISPQSRNCAAPPPSSAASDSMN